MPGFTSMSIKFWLMERGKGSPYDFWKWFNEQRARQGKKPVTYAHICKYFWLLRELGLIEEAGEEVNSRGSPIPKKLYRVVSERLDDEAWFNPQKAYRERRG